MPVSKNKVLILIHFIASHWNSSHHADYNGGNPYKPLCLGMSKNLWEFHNAC